MSKLPERAARIVGLAKMAGLTLATVESCTAGALAVLLADAPEAGTVFQGGFVVYTKENKTAALGISARLIQEKSAVSAEVAKAMVAGALERCPADVAVAITGVAGPTPDEDGNPVGLVYVAVARRGEDPRALEHHFEKGPRGHIRDRAMESALKQLEGVLAKPR